MCLAVLVSSLNNQETYFSSSVNSYLQFVSHILAYVKWFYSYPVFQYIYVALKNKRFHAEWRAKMFFVSSFAVFTSEWQWRTSLRTIFSFLSSSFFFFCITWSFSSHSKMQQKLNHSLFCHISPPYSFQLLEPDYQHVNTRSSSTNYRDHYPNYTWSGISLRRLRCEKCHQGRWSSSLSAVWI